MNKTKAKPIINDKPAGTFIVYPYKDQSEDYHMAFMYQRTGGEKRFTLHRIKKDHNGFFQINQKYNDGRMTEIGDVINELAIEKQKKVFAWPQKLLFYVTPTPTPTYDLYTFGGQKIYQSMNDKQAKELLDKNPDGSYLIRTENTTPISYQLSLKLRT